MSKPRVAVLRGGISNEYEISMKTGASVLRALDTLNYPKKDVVITRKGEWLDGGKVKKPEMTLVGIDVVFLALHGEHGEDGSVQKFLTHHHIPYTGSRALASATAFNKVFTKQLLQKAGVKTPAYQIFNQNSCRDQMVKLNPELTDRIVIKPAACGSSLDTYVNIDATVGDVLVQTLLERYENVLVEEYIEGREFTAGLIENFRDSPHYVLPVIEILPNENHSFYSYEAKYGGETRFECPGRLSKKEYSTIQDVTTIVHRELDLRHYSRSDFLVKDGIPYFLEVNTLPGLTEHSLFPQALEAVGAKYTDLISHLINNASP